MNKKIVFNENSKNFYFQNGNKQYRLDFNNYIDNLTDTYNYNPLENFKTFLTHLFESIESNEEAIEILMENIFNFLECDFEDGKLACNVIFDNLEYVFYVNNFGGYTLGVEVDKLRFENVSIGTAKFNHINSLNIEMIQIIGNKFLSELNDRFFIYRYKLVIKSLIFNRPIDNVIES